MTIAFPDKPVIVSYSHSLRSRYSETDRMGYVYYGRYLEYFEVARTELIRSMGVSYARLEDDGYMLPVIYSQIEYKTPVFYDEEMMIEVSVYEKPLVRLETYYKITTYRHEGFHARGQVNLCFMNRDTRKPCRAPDYFQDLIKP